jgi:hypothetical protein
MSFDYMGEVPTGGHGHSTTEIPNPYMEELMKCPHLRRWTVAACRIDEKVYVPSVFQLEEYCKTSGHRKCPFFVKSLSVKKDANGRLPVREYA